jgi:hypothetical protein
LACGAAKAALETSAARAAPAASVLIIMDLLRFGAVMALPLKNPERGRKFTALPLKRQSSVRYFWLFGRTSLLS